MAEPRVRFGSFELAPATGELWLDGRRVRLQRQRGNRAGEVKRGVTIKQEEQEFRRSF